VTIGKKRVNSGGRMAVINRGLYIIFLDQFIFLHSASTLDCCQSESDYPEL